LAQAFPNFSSAPFPFLQRSTNSASIVFGSPAHPSWPQHHRSFASVKVIGRRIIFHACLSSSSNKRNATPATAATAAAAQEKNPHTRTSQVLENRLKMALSKAISWGIALSATLPSVLGQSWTAPDLEPQTLEQLDQECLKTGDPHSAACALSALSLRSRRLSSADAASGGSEEEVANIEQQLESLTNNTANLAETSGSWTNRLTIVNGCPNHPMWIAHIVTGGIGPDTQDLKLEPGQQYSFATALNGQGLVATRYWPKMGCDAHGGNCRIGESGGPGESCVAQAPDYKACAPPVDSKFEATFANPGSERHDTVDMSLVDGYTLPFSLEIQGTCVREGQPFASMDCRGLSVQQCPNSESLGGVGYDLKAHNPKTNKVAGCYSPCMRLTDNKWYNPVSGPTSHPASPYCCAGQFSSPQTCNAGGSGSVLHTQYLAKLRQACPLAYGYAYDDRSATIVCNSNTQYKVTFFCPDMEV